jgi:hypothetical protein
LFFNGSDFIVLIDRHLVFSERKLLLERLEIQVMYMNTRTLTRKTTKKMMIKTSLSNFWHTLNQTDTLVVVLKRTEGGGNQCKTGTISSFR